MHLSPPVAQATVRSKAVVLFVVESLLIVTPIVGFCNCSTCMFCCAYFLSILVYNIGLKTLLQQGISEPI